MNLTSKVISPLYQTINNGYDITELQNDSENYCKQYNKDLRIYLLSLKIAENQKDTTKYLDKFFSYFNNVNDFTNIWSEYTLWQLGDKDHGVINYCKDFRDCEKSVQDVINLLEQYGDNIPESAARSAARSADAAARSAAWSAAARSAADAATRSAASSAQSAASSADRSAAWSARSADRSADAAAWSAAWSAAESAADAAWSAAWSAVWENMANKLLEILKGRQ